MGCYLKYVFIFYLDLKCPKYLCFCVFRDGCQVLGSKPELLAALFALTSDLSIAVAKDCYFILVNLSADRSLHQVMGPAHVQHDSKQQPSLTVNKNTDREENPVVWTERHFLVV